MITLLAAAMFWGLCCAVVGVVWAHVIAGEDNPLNFWFKWLNTWHEAPGWHSWVSSPIGGCQKCFSGQLALWTSSVIMSWSWSPWSIAVHFVSACTAVLCAIALTHFVRWTVKHG